MKGIMSQSRLDDMYERLSSRKLWLALLSIAFAFWNFHDGRMTAVEFQQSVAAAVITFSVAESAVRAVGAYRPKPATGDAQTVNVGNEAVELAAAPTTVRRKARPSRAKPKEPKKHAS